ncbi:MAG: HAMP domain-containing sensor histidine kinase [Chloroflexota bacterium]
MPAQPDYDKLLVPIDDVTTSIEALLSGAFGQLMGDQREGLKRIYAMAWGLHTLLMDIVTNIDIDSIAYRAYLSNKFDEHINPLIATAQSLLNGVDGPLTDEQIVSVDFIRVTGELLRHYVDNLWLYSQLKHGLWELKRTPATVDELFQPMTWGVSENPVALEVFVPEEDIPPITVDARLIRTSIAQIVDNAVNNTQQGTIKVSLSDTPDELVVIVRDTGCGINEKHQQQIFEPFFQVDKEKLGLGLGLTITQQALQLHNGTITLKTTQPHGTEARLCLPRNS